QLGVTCSGGGTCTTAHTYAQRWRWIIITAAETVRPSIAATGGQLLAGGAQRGTRRLAYTATDPDSGVARIQVLLGDRVVGERRLSDDRSSCAHRSWN